MGLAASPLSAESFRGALRSVACGVNVITMWTGDGRPLGMTATAFSPVSTDPLLVLVCVNRSTRTYQHIAESGRFGVNVLGSTAREISDHCSRPGADKLLNPDWLAPLATGSPALTSALAFLDCAVEQDVTAGTHAVLIGTVQAIGRQGDGAAPDPLLYYQGRYRHLAPPAHRQRVSSLPAATRHD